MNDTPSLPDPPVSSDVDLTGFPGFLLNVNRLLASELVALGTPEECWAAMMLWCRAWQQNPPGSLPDDDRILASFSCTGKRWPKIKSMALRGFIKCSDGRLYHFFLAEEAMKAWKKRKNYNNDQTRLKRWRNGQRNGDGNGDGNGDETRFKLVSETGVKRVRSRREGKEKENKKERCSDTNVSDAGASPGLDFDPRKIVFDQCLAWLSASTGKPEDKLRSLVGRWCRDHGNGDVIDIIAAAQKMAPVDPLSWIEATFQHRSKHDPEPNINESW